MNRYVLVTKGGPKGMQIHVVPSDQYGWPLPKEIRLPLSGVRPWLAGRYVKVYEGPIALSPGEVMRGAHYQWVRDSG